MFAKNKKNKNKGFVLVWAAISLLVFLGFAALAIDIAYFYHTKHQLQGAADAAALAGAALLKCENFNGSNVEQTEARNAAHEYAFKNIAASQSVDTKLNTGNDPNGDIVIGHWDGTNFTPDPGAPLQNGALINAVKVVGRRTSEPSTDIKVGDNPVSTFFGKIFNVSTVNISSKAVAQGCVKLAPIAINEYWMGNSPLGGTPGNCSEPAQSDPFTGGGGVLRRSPYGKDHVYPDSFVRPPCNSWLNNKCNPPSSNGNVAPFPTLSCDPNLNQTGPGQDPVLVNIVPNGPLPVGELNCIDRGPVGCDHTASNPCACDGRPSGMPRAGRVFAIVGKGAYQNSPGGDMHSLLNLDERIGYSLQTAGEQWYRVFGDTFTQIDNASPNPDKSIIAGYIASGIYPNTLPVSVTDGEVFQPNYYGVNLYTTNQPYASISFPSGMGLPALGQMMRAFYDGGNYSGGKYAPGEQIYVTVYDGIVDGAGAGDRRTTIVGFARVTIFGYSGNAELNLGPTGEPTVPPAAGNTNELTMYGYIERTEDFKLTYRELVRPEEGRSRLVQ